MFLTKHHASNYVAKIYESNVAPTFTQPPCPLLADLEYMNVPSVRQLDKYSPSTVFMSFHILRLQFINHQVFYLDFLHFILCKFSIYFPLISGRVLVGILYLFNSYALRYCTTLRNLCNWLGVCISAFTDFTLYYYYITIIMGLSTTNKKWFPVSLCALSAISDII